MHKMENETVCGYIHCLFDWSNGHTIKIIINYQIQNLKYHNSKIIQIMINFKNVIFGFHFFMQNK